MLGEQRTQLYEAVGEALKGLDCDIGASECHGILCGMLCGPEEFEPAVWISDTTGRADVPTIAIEDSEHALWALLDETVNTLDSDELSLVMMLPDDDDPLVERTAALGAWCRGFLSGFGLTGLTELTDFSSDSRGFLSDLADISRVDADRAKGETDEQALFELTEYVRVGALLVREETRFILADTDPSGTVH